jgi:hypothetical protein
VSWVKDRYKKAAELEETSMKELETTLEVLDDMDYSDPVRRGVSREATIERWRKQMQSELEKSRKKELASAPRPWQQEYVLLLREKHMVANEELKGQNTGIGFGARKAL